jgi:hypothetical protein
MAAASLVMRPTAGAGNAFLNAINILKISRNFIDDYQSFESACATGTQAISRSARSREQEWQYSLRNGVIPIPNHAVVESPQKHAISKKLSLFQGRAPLGKRIFCCSYAALTVRWNRSGRAVTPAFSIHQKMCEQM